jgi:CheY-like chemotaxis protein
MKSLRRALMLLLPAWTALLALAASWVWQNVLPEPGLAENPELQSHLMWIFTADAGMAAVHPMKNLVAEDNAVNRRMMETMLKRFGYAADFAEDGKLAVAALQRKRYDLVFMDMQMPEMDGCTAARTFRQWERASQRPPVPIVALTANAMAGDKEKCIRAGMNAYLTKPLKLDELRRVLTQAASGQPISAGA